MIQDSIRQIVREELAKAFSPSAIIQSPTPLKRVRVRNRPAQARSGKATLFGDGKGRVKNPKRDMRLKANRDTNKEE